MRSDDYTRSANGPAGQSGSGSRQSESACSVWSSSVTARLTTFVGTDRGLPVRMAARAEARGSVDRYGRNEHVLVRWYEVMN